MRPVHAFVAGALSLVAAGRLSAFSPEQNHQAPGDVSSQAAMDRRADFLARHPGAQLYLESDRVVRVFGVPMSSGDDVVACAEAFRIAEAGLFGVSMDDLRPVDPFQILPHVLPLYFQRDTGDHKFVMVYYSQAWSDWPVFRADLRLLIRNEPGHPLVLAASSLRDLGTFAPAADLLANLRNEEFIDQRFQAAREQALLHTPDLTDFSRPSIVVWAGIDDNSAAPAFALMFEGDNAAAGAAVTNRVRFLADVQSGAILYTEPLILHADISGVVQGLASEGLAADQCTEEVPMPMPYAAIIANGETIFADVDGQYVYSTDITHSILIESPMSGQWFTVSNAQGSTETLSQNVLAPNIADFMHNAANADMVRPQVNAYISANQVRDLALSVAPAYPTLQNPSFPIVVNRVDQFCPGNAWYDIILASINFCLPGEGHPNTAWTSVVYHEYGHHLVQVGGSGQGQYGEGMSDVVSMLLLDDPRLGLGFFGPCDQSLRSAEAGLQYPCTGSGHTCGQLISGCAWFTRNALAQSEPEDYRNILAQLAINSIPLHSGTSITPQITIDWLVLDDDDAVIDNGTPHCSEICEGFGLHNMDCPAQILDSFDFSFPDGLPSFIPPDVPAPIRVQLTSGTPVDLMRAFYRVGESGPFTEVVLEESPPGEYTFTVPPQACLDTVEYYFVAQGGCSTTHSPPSGALEPHRTNVASLITQFIQLDFETNPGWTVSGNATDGQWDRGIPINCDRGDPPADADGSGQCWLTDNSSANLCNSDVDSGTTILTTHTMNVSGLVQPFVRYWRWFNNAAGSSPETDRMIVEISSNGGLSWSALEIVGPTSQSPNPEVFGGWVEVFLPVPVTSQLRLRFAVEDVLPSSVVEAGIDGFEIIDWQCGAACAGPTGDINADELVNGSDVVAFVEAALGTPGPAELCAGDYSTDGVLDENDVAGFVGALLAP